MNLEERLRSLLAAGELDLPLPGRGQTAERHRQLAAVARENLALARLAEAHTDAIAILAEAGLKPAPGALYGVWASEIAQQALHLEPGGAGWLLTGRKMFCTGAGLLDRALVTAGSPEQRLIEVDLRANTASIAFDGSAWITGAFAETQTATAQFVETPVEKTALIGAPGFYLDRPGFWHGACGPASCWAGGAMGLVDYARKQNRGDAHTLAHLGAMTASVWGLSAYLEAAGREIDAHPGDVPSARSIALSMRHLVEQAASDILRRFGRAYGPRPLAFDMESMQRYHEVELYIRQCHAEHDLESLGRLKQLAP